MPVYICTLMAQISLDIDLLHVEIVDAEDIESVTDSRSTRIYALPGE